MSTSFKASILNWMITNGRTSTVNIASGLGISVPTVSKFLKELLAEGFVQECGIEDVQRGRKPMSYAVNPDACCFVGVDIKHDHFYIMSTDLAGKVISFRKVSEDYEFESTPAILERICKETRSFIAENVNREKLCLISWNISGRVNAKSGDSYSIFNFEGDEKPLSQILSDKLSFPVVIENDTRAMAYGEQMIGKLQHYRDALYINFSWGIGMAMLIDGKLYNGASGYSGEIGHLNAYDNDIICHCGKKGCLETEVSVSAIARKLEHELRMGKSSILSLSKGKLSSKEIAEAVSAGDPLTLEVVEQAAKELGKHIANFINIFNPEAVVIGGAEDLCSDYFMITVKQSVAKHALRLIMKNVEIERSVLTREAGALGACLNARRIFIQQLESSAE